ncbi:unnamed protein product [Arctogadus glacialis]
MSSNQPAFDTLKPGNHNPPNATLPQPTLHRPSPRPSAPRSLYPDRKWDESGGEKGAGGGGGEEGIEERLFHLFTLHCAAPDTVPHKHIPLSRESLNTAPRGGPDLKGGLKRAPQIGT